MGAEVSKTFSRRVTHVVFKHGHQSTWSKAQKMGVKVVSVHWVDRCKEDKQHVDEALYPAVHYQSKDSVFNKRTHRCMQPRDAPVRTPENDKRLKKKLDKMIEGLVPSSPIVSGLSPLIIDEENGIVYSPSWKSSETMAERLKEMREQRENLSPTASQIENPDLTDDTSPQPSLDGSVSTFQQKLEEESDRPGLTVVHSCPPSDQFKGEEQNSASGSVAEQNVGVDQPKTPRRARRSTSMSKTADCSDFVPFRPNDDVFACSSVKPGGVKRQSSLTSFFLNSSSTDRKSESEILTRERTKAPRRMSRRSLPKPEVKMKLPDDVQPVEAKSKTSEAVKKVKPDTLCPILPPSGGDWDVSRGSSSRQKSRKQSRTASNGSSISPACLGDDGEFEDYFSPINKPGRRRTVVLDVASEPFELNLNPLKRKRSKTDMKEQKNPCSAAEALAGNGSSEDLLLRPRSSKSEPEFERHLTSGENLICAADGASDGSSEMFRCQDDARKDRNEKTKRTLVMTSMPTEKQETVLQVVRSLGGFAVADSVCESTTHVVTGSPRRTLNVLLGIARGCWILSFEWILWCLEHRQWIPEEPYELSDHFPAAPICRLQQHLSAGEHQQDLFRGLPVMYVTPQSQPPAHSLEELIKLCGGAVSRTVRQAGICIGEHKGRKAEGTVCLSEQWVLGKM
uniref:BRCT domain-containing protein n=1 Tax=Denticeps clupeoides TaxID=299321 RepID=A0AAY4DV87_9TELE